MTPSLFATRLMGLAGVAGFAGCAATLRAASPSMPAARALYPEIQSPFDSLSVDPCGVKSSPDVFLREAPFESLRPLRENLQFLKDINPIFLCGLERVEVLGDEAYKASADPKYTRRSVGLYTPVDRVIHLKASAGITLTHEVGHHVHNLGYFAPTVREFLSQSWTYDATGKRVHRCEGSDCFLGDAAASEVTEDWARTFDQVLMRPIETSVAVNFSLKEDGETPLQKKVALIRSISNLAKPLSGVVRFGEAKEATLQEVVQWEGADSSTALPATLPHDTVRRLHKEGMRAVKSWVWDNRRRPFMAGSVVVFPAFLKERNRLGFFAYDLSQEKFLPMTLKLENLPREFRNASFTDLEVVMGPTDTLLLVGRRAEEPPLAVPMEFSVGE